MAVSKQNVKQAVAELNESRLIGLDTETYGVGHDDKMFSLILCGADTVFYFNLYAGSDHLGNYVPSEYVLGPSDLAALVPLFDDPGKLWAIHNAKFDMRRLALENATLEGEVHCTYAIERVLMNNYMLYSLAACAKRRGWEKSTKVDNYIKRHKLYDMTLIPGKKKREKNMHFEKVPFEIMKEYACLDAILHRELCLDQTRGINGAV